MGACNTKFLTFALNREVCPEMVNRPVAVRWGNNGPVCQGTITNIVSDTVFTMVYHEDGSEETIDTEVYYVKFLRMEQDEHEEILSSMPRCDNKKRKTNKANKPNKNKKKATKKRRGRKSNKKAMQKRAPTRRMKRETIHPDVEGMIRRAEAKMGLSFN